MQLYEIVGKGGETFNPRDKHKRIFWMTHCIARYLKEYSQKYHKEQSSKEMMNTAEASSTRVLPLRLLIQFIL